MDKPFCTKLSRHAVKRKPCPEFSHNSHCRTPPPRGAPGALQRANEECTPPGEGTTTKPGGVASRRVRRRAYRRWRRQGKHERETGMGSPLLVPTQPKKAAQSRANWFKNTLYWPEQHKRKKGRKPKNYPTTPQLGYDHKVKVRRFFECSGFRGYA